jgi:alpha-beta hydrolase superfamily lysophospholipase
MTSLISDDGVRLHYRFWPASGAVGGAGGSAHGTVQIVHGLGEHIGRYAGVAAALNDAGWDVVGHDQRGHGRSEGRRGKIPRADTLLQDVATVMYAVRGDRPHVLLGHSLGGLVAARYVAEGMASPAARWWRPVDGLVMSSPALDPGLGIFNRMLLSVLGPVAPNMLLANHIKPAALCRDPAVVHAYTQDKLVHDRITPRLVRFIADSAALLHERAANWPLRTLLLWAGADRVVRPAGSANFATAAPAHMLTARVFPGLYHEIFNEPERVQVLRQVANWLRHYEAQSQPYGQPQGFDSAWGTTQELRA